MKKNIKKIIVGIFALGALFLAQDVFAATWNGASNDCPSVNVANATTGAGWSDPCWTGTSISANPGDVVSVRIYYHNTGTVTATNTKVYLDANTSAGTSHRFSGSISSNQGNLSFGPVYINTNPAQSLSFNSVKWYTENTKETLTSLLNGQDGSEILDSGLLIGSIAPGWPTQGSLVVNFKVNEAPEEIKECVITNFSASPSSITEGSFSKLSWATSNCDSASIGGIGSVSASGSKVVYPLSTTIYSLSAYGDNSEDVVTTKVTVTQIVNEIMSGNLSVSPSSCTIPAGSSTCSLGLSWNTLNPEAISSVTSGSGTIATGNNGSKSVSITNGSRSYYLYNNSKLLDTENVSASCASGSSWNGSYCAPTSVNEMSGNLSVSPSSCTIPTGSSTCSLGLSWNTLNPEAISSVTSGSGTIATGNNGSKSVSISNGSRSYYLYNNSKLLDTENVSASCASGSSWNGSYCTVEIIEENDCSVTSFKASPSSIEKGDSSIISWTTSNCSTISISGVGSYGLGKNSSQVVWPTSTKTYTITAVGSNGSTSSRTTTVYVGEQSNNNECRIDVFSASDTSINDGDSIKLRWNTTGCDRVKISNIGNVDEDGSKTVKPDEDITYTLTAYNINGDSIKDTVRIYVDGDNDDNEEGSCKIDSFKTSDSYIDQGELSKLTWRTTDCKNVTISNIGRVPEDGSEIVYPYTTTTFILKAYGDNNNDTETLKINVGNDYVYEYNTNVVTTVATNITQNSASLNGLLTNTSSNAQDVYFEYGTTVNMANQTNVKTISGSANFTEYVSELTPNTIYFFQAVSSGKNGVSRGAIEVFRTPGYTVVTPVTSGGSTNTVTRVVQGTTVAGSASPVMLEIENKYQTLSRGDFIEYAVYYKNISRSTLIDPMVQVYIPEGITVTNASAGTYSKDDRILSVPIEDLRPQEEGIIYLQAKVDSIDSTRAQIVTTAILVYTNPNGAQENAMAYVLNNPGDASSNLLGASAFQGGFLGLSLAGWLFLVLLILLIVLIARTYYNKEPNK